MGLWMLLILSLCLIFALAACGNNDNEGNEGNEGTTDGEGDEFEEMTISWAGTTPDGHSLTTGSEKFKELVEERTNGKVTVELFPNLQLGSLREQTEAAQLGTVNLSMSLVSILSTFKSDLEPMDYFYLWPDDEEQIWDVLDGETGQELLGKLDSEGFVGLGFWSGGWKAMTSNDDPILSVDNLRGVNVRVIPSNILIRNFENYGANPVPIDFAELYNALQQGTVDAQENPLDTIWVMNFHEVQDHLTWSTHGYQFHSLVANEEWFNNLSPQLREVVVESAEEARLFARAENDANIEIRLDQITESGVEYHELSAEARQEFVGVSEQLYDELADTEGKQEVLNLILDALGR